MFSSDRLLRLRAFRSRHHVGERLRGVMLRPALAHEGEGLVWLRIGPDELLARVASTFAAGRVVHLEVQQLDPEVVLRELDAAATGPHRAAAAVQRFLAARSGFEAQTTDLDWTPIAAAPTVTARRQLFFASLTAPLTAAYLDAALASVELDSLLHEGHGFAWLPWLVPTARGCERLCLSSGALRETVFECDFSHGSGPGRVRIQVVQGTASAKRTCRLLVEHPLAAKTLSRLAPGLLPDELASIVALPPHTPGLAAGLAGHAATGRGGLSAGLTLRA